MARKSIYPVEIPCAGYGKLFAVSTAKRWLTTNRGKRFYHSHECRLAAMPSLMGRFLALTDKNGPISEKCPERGPCWIWLGAKKRGYGKILVEGKLIEAHIAAWLLFREPIQDGYERHHICENKACVNPDHMEAVTKEEHSRRHTPGLYNKVKTHCPQGHQYTPENTYYNNGHRQCRTCNIRRATERQRICVARLLPILPSQLLPHYCAE